MVGEYGPMLIRLEYFTEYMALKIQNQTAQFATALPVDPLPLCYKPTDGERMAVLPVPVTTIFRYHSYHVLRCYVENRGTTWLSGKVFD